MSRLPFDAFFQKATEKPKPYGYQCRLACGPDADPGKPNTLREGTDCRSRLIDVPTGFGKTAAVVVAWIWNRAHLQNPKWPRRLVYCLPMRTLVEQTRDEAKKWIADLHKDNLLHDKPLKVIVLMGGEELEGDAKDWDIYPEENAILIGTQDMLLSRALNRGYGMNRYRWPMHFGLLNNDCLWVMDETQLMGVGVETSAQLDGFRHMGTMPTFGVCPTWWMSATLDDARLSTVDHPKPGLVEKLSDAEQSSGRPKELFEAKKSVAPCPVTLSAATEPAYAKQLAELVAKQHQHGTLTIVIVNRVSRAREIFEALTTVEKKAKQPLYDPSRVALIHSRFRRADRKRHEELLFGEGDRIVIATQAIEAGVDVSARLLITELAPWSSLVQRMGRCNRRAEPSGGEVLWVDIEPDAKGELLLPYSKDELTQAQNTIRSLTDASLRSLAGVSVQEKPVIRPVIRRRDLVDLFDTTPDICGQDLDVSRYIRDGDDNDVQFFWRSVEEDAPTDKEPPPHRDELCRVSIGDAVKFLGKKPRAWRWNPLSEEWEGSKIARPGVVYLLDVKSGGYSDATGWTGDPKDKPTPHPPKDGELPKYADNRLTFTGTWQSLAEHTTKVASETKAISAALAISDADAALLHTAAVWHDIGKAHGEFQAMLVSNDVSRQDTLWAKSENKNGRCNRHGFRHELASALAWLLKGPVDAVEHDLIAYIIAAHHGKVRLSIRSLPDEPAPDLPPMPDGTERLFARGIWHQHKDDAEKHDVLPPVDLGELKTPEITLDLSFMKMGEGEHGPSWLARTVALRDRLGPFRLAFLETLLRAADARASSKTETVA